MATITISTYITKPGVEGPVLWNRDVNEDVLESTFEVLYKGYMDALGDTDVQRDGSTFEALNPDGSKVIVELEV
jgi:hypothetical protein